MVPMRARVEAVRPANDGRRPAAAELLAHALGGLGLAAFVCDAQAAVLALTPQAEAVLRRGALQVRCGRLCGGPALAAALARARGGAAPVDAVVLRRDEALEVLDVLALPAAPQAGGGEPRLLVVARGAGGDGRRAGALLQAAFGLTPTESAVALQVAEGESTDEIAAGRGIAVATLRSHLKAVFCKTGVSRRAELVARLRAFR